MTSTDKKAKILASIASRGWWPCDIYFTEAAELRAEGKITQDTIYTIGGNKRWVWKEAQ